MLSLAVGVVVGHGFILACLPAAPGLVAATVDLVVVYVLDGWRVVLREVNAEIRWEIYHDRSLAGRGRALPYETYGAVNRRLFELGGPPLEDMTEG